jgi:hypothetical protein
VSSAINPDEVQASGTVGKPDAPMTCTGTGAGLLAPNLDVGELHRPPRVAVLKRKAFDDRIAAGTGLTG